MDYTLESITQDHLNMIIEKSKGKNIDTLLEDIRLLHLFVNNEKFKPAKLQNLPNLQKRLVNALMR